MKSAQAEIIPQSESKELQVFTVRDAVIAVKREQFMKLTVKGIEDKDGLASVHSARMEMVKLRTNTTKEGKAERDKLTAINRQIKAEEDRLLGLMAPIEAHLETEENKVTAELARIKKEAEEKLAAKIQERRNIIFDFGARFDGQNYTALGVTLGESVLKSATDDSFKNIVAQFQKAYDDEAARVAAEEAAKKAEEERLAKIAAEQEAERKRLEDIRLEQERKAEEERRIFAAEQERIRKEREAQDLAAQAERDRIRKEQDAKEAALKAEADRIAAEKKAIEDEKQRKIDEEKRQAELEKARIEAAERAKLEEADRIKKEEAARIEAERLAKLEAERIESLRPDKEKLLTFADQLAHIAVPDLSTEEGQRLGTQALASVLKLALDLRKKANALTEKED